MRFHFITYQKSVEKGIHKFTLCGKDSVEYNNQPVKLWGVSKPSSVTCLNCKKIAQEIAK